MKRMGRIISKIFYAALLFGLGAVLGLGVRTEEKLTDHVSLWTCKGDGVCEMVDYRDGLKIVGCKYQGLRGIMYARYLVEDERGDGGIPGLRQLSEEQKERAKAGDIEGICPWFYPVHAEEAGLPAKSAEQM